MMNSAISYLLVEIMSRCMHPDEEDDSTVPLNAEELPLIYYPDHELAKSSTCAICLETFQGEERCRECPVCKHVFHAQCIDLWLAKRHTCPICRTPCKIEESPDAV
ncbi:hypothetical protein Vadar_029937 [Vaccinium darrowii]|uniref:Uncharacterized protein n=1 Tax=Vaccinium darrowii TaxID=229202 RepID=A0ACB7Y3F3_9ERIC|nr:hypothetical protein Vadar_029937 [Vaccinium darrowii]